MRKSPLGRHSDIVIQAAGDETLIYDLKTNKAYCLNESSSAIWKLCDGNRSVSEMSFEMSKRMNAQISEDFIWLALEQFDKDGLVVGKLEPNVRFTGMSRREVIRTIGFASAVALPIVSSIVAPEASMAQSGGIGLLGQCFATSGQQGNCNPGLKCLGTKTIATATGTIPTGINQCCDPSSSILSGTGYASSPCGSLNPSCGGIAPTPAPPDPNCGALFTCTFTS